METFSPDQATDNGAQLKEVKTLRVTMPNGKSYNMPADVAASMLEHFAKNKRSDFIKAHANAVMGEQS